MISILLLPSSQPGSLEEWKKKRICENHESFYHIINPLSARIFTVFGRLLKDRVLHKEAWIAKLLGNHLSIQAHKKIKFSWRDNSPLALKGLSANVENLDNIVYTIPKYTTASLNSTKYLAGEVLVCSYY